jgi:hypothetical protein
VPARLFALARVLAQFGVDVRPPTGGGSHWRAGRADGRSYRIPAHNGERTEINDKYIRGLCREFGIDYAELKKRL